MMAHTLELENDLVSTLIKALNHAFDSTPSNEEARSKAEQLAKPFGYGGNLKPIVDRALMAITTRMGSGVSLIQKDTGHDSDWINKRTNIDWIYSDAYFDYLDSSGWSNRMCQSLRDVSEKILGMLQNPISDGIWDRRGLVIGNVQSGKTANYLALITRAADAGYKFIIVIAGIHNVLRSQTQQRIDEGFVGRHSESRQIIGVGKTDLGRTSQFPHPVTLTNVSNDFNKQVARQSGWRLNDFSRPIILVVKKNVNVLTSLYHWLKDMNAQGADQIETVPMLLIDDEADHASINTNKLEHDPTRTNRLIRQILRLFAKSSFVGYTATPFANIFINPDAYDDEVRDDLFPRDFIYFLDAPTTYFGPERVFLTEDVPSQVTIPVTDCDDVLPLSHKKDHEISVLPASLYTAINEFIVARAIRNLRGYQAHHCSMMINVSRFVNVQKQIRDLVSIYLREVKEAVQANYAMRDPISSRNASMQKLKKAFDRAFPYCGHSWVDVKAELQKAATSTRLFMINGQSDDRLDYKKHEASGSGLTAIAVGGLSLSRGLTIEGLCVSYVYRNTRMYDTLMQMGRWFGYRLGYDDLCRVHLSGDAISWYSHVAEATRELVDQVRDMRQMGKTPREFGLYVETHPDQLLITSPRKMQDAEKRTLRYNYSGRLQEFTILPTDPVLNSKNEELILETWTEENRERAKRPGKGSTKGWIVRDVPTEKVERFLTQFTTDKSLEHKKTGVINYLRKTSDKYQTCDVVLVSIESREDPSKLLHLGAQERKSTIKDGKWVLNKGRAASRGDEGLGLSKEQVYEAFDRAKQNNRVGNVIDADYRATRTCPLLMIHVLTGKTGSSLENIRIPTIGMSFPPDDYITEVEIVANPVYIRLELFATHGMRDDDFDVGED